MHPDTRSYNDAQPPADHAICALLAETIDRCLPDAENRVWHAHPVWFLDGNPVAGYAKRKDGVRLLFWSGQSFAELPGTPVPGKVRALRPEGTFKAAEARYVSVDEVDPAALEAWLDQARHVQWDYKNVARRKGVLERLK